MAGSYDTSLVLLSIVVAMMASYSALDLAGRVTHSGGRAARLWLLGGAMAMGAGIWSMHFIGMLAFSLPIRLAYDLSITFASMLIAMVISGFALAVVSRTTLSLRLLLAGGVIMGLGICAMHYTGMAAMRMSPPIRYDPLLFTASVLIAVGASIVALFLAFTLRARATGSGILYRVLSAMVMGLAITGMHYTGMAAANYEPGSLCLATGTFNLANETLAYVIATAVLSLLAVTLMASIFDARMASHAIQMLRQVEQANLVLKREIEERKAVEEKLARYADHLKQSNQELEQFAYVASHDLQAPLRSVVSFTQLLAQDYQQHFDDKAREYMEFIVQNGVQMQALIKDLLAFSRVGRQDSTLVPTDCEQVLGQVLTQLKSTLEERHVQVTQDPLPVVSGVPHELNQLFQNLLSNAIKFQPGENPRVHISAARDGNFWKFSVRDWGIGIKPEHQTRIFQIFQRLHTSKEYDGTGIGLALSQKIVTRHGGRIWVESEPGRGTTFHFTLLPTPEQ